MLVGADSGVTVIQILHPQAAQLLVVLMGLFSFPATTYAEAPKPYYLACSSSDRVDLWLIEEARRKATLVDTWNPPKGTWIASRITTAPKTGVIVVPTRTDNPDTDPNDPNREGVYFLDDFKTLTSLNLSGEKLVPTDWGQVGYGHPILAPNGKRIAMVGDQGCYGYIDLQSKKKDATLTDPEHQTWVDADLRFIGSSSDSSISAIATWRRIAEDVSHYTISRFAWQGGRVKESFEFELPIAGPGVSLSADGTLLLIEKTSIQRVFGGLNGAEKQVVQRGSFGETVGPFQAGVSHFAVQTVDGKNAVVSAAGHWTEVGSRQSSVNRLASSVAAITNTYKPGAIAFTTFDKSVSVGAFRNGSAEIRFSFPGEYSGICFVSRLER